MSAADFRIERDALGEKSVPREVYWGIHTQRARENFDLSGWRVSSRLIRALAQVKKACCQANEELEYLEKEKGRAIAHACDEIVAGELSDQFPLDALQGGAGTSTNMNINEVLANRAAEILGAEKGRYDLIHPLDHVNLHQSTNDVYPTAVKVALIGSLKDLSQAIARLQGIFQKKEKEFSDILKIGRTELQEAVPMTLGVEFSAFAEAFGRDRWRVFKCEERLRIVNLGGTAIGTGLAAPRKYIFLVVEKLRQITGFGLARAENTVEATANTDVFVEVSGILKAHAANLLKISNDLRLLNLLGEIRLETVQAGSSIMPGKVNPVLLESVMQVAMKVMADDFLVTETVSRSSFQINEFLPLLAQAILESLDLLCRANESFGGCVENIKPDESVCRKYFEQSPTIATALLPYLGYEKISGLMKEFASSNEKNLFVFLRTQLGEEMVARVFSAQGLTSLGYRDDGKDT